MDENNNQNKKEIYEKINSVSILINNIQNHLLTILSDNIITNNRYNDLIDKLKFVKSQLNIQVKKINEISNNDLDRFKENYEFDDNTIGKIDDIKNNIISIKNELIKIVIEYGYFSIDMVLELMLDTDDYNFYRNNIDDKNLSINKYFRVINVGKSDISSTNKINYSIRNILKKDSEDSKYDVLDEEKLKINLIYELNKANIEIEIKDTLYIFKGYFVEDILNDIFNDIHFSGKYKKILNYYNDKNKVDYLKYKVFVREYLIQYNIKDFIIN
jgi:hypothetical protein